MSEEEWVPSWCGYFSRDEYEAFLAAVEGATSCYGVDEVGADPEYIELAAGDDHEIRSLSLVGLAAQCRDSPQADWKTLCFGRISDFVEGRLHREWLNLAPFDVAEPLLRVSGLTEQPELLYVGGTMHDPDEPFSIPLAPRLYLSLIADVPELDEADEAAVLVPNSAVLAWQKSAEDLLESARRRLRSLPPPTWSTRTVRFDNDLGPTTVDLYVATAAPEAEASNIPVTAWFLLIDEIFPYPFPRGAFVGLPERNTLVVALNEEREVASDIHPALLRVVNSVYDEALSEDRGTRQLFAFGHQEGFRAVPSPASHATLDG